MIQLCSGEMEMMSEAQATHADMIPEGALFICHAAKGPFRPRDATLTCAASVQG